MKHRSVALLFSACLALAIASPAAAQKAVILVRHGEKFSETDERLTEAGHARAARLAAMLKDAGVKAIYSTDTERTRGTVQPLADSLGLTVQIYDKGVSMSRPQDLKQFVEKLRKDNAGDIVLVAGHTNTLPELLKNLGCPGDFKIASDEYDNIFIVVPKGDGTATLVRMRY